MTRRDVEFVSSGETCAGWLYVPDDLDGARAPAIVMANAISAVREITLPGYAERFCAAGFVVLAFDYRNFGASGGTPRQHLDPRQQQQDIGNAITWLRAQPEVDADNVGGWGVSLGGTHMLRLGAFDRRLKAVVSVATGLNTMEAMMGREGMLAFLRILNGDHDRRFHTGEDATYLPAVSPPGGGGVMAFPEANDFYEDARATFAPAYDNRLTLESVENLIADHSADSLPLIAPTALLMIHGEKDLIPPAAVSAVFGQANEPKRLVLLDCLHTDLYTREPWVTQSASEAIAWFNRYLHNERGRAPVAHDIEKNKAIIRNFYEESHKGNLEVYDELFAPEFVSYSSATGGEIRGPGGFKSAYQMYAGAFPDFNTTIDMIIAEGPLVMVYGVATGTHQGEFLGLPPTGKACTWTGIAVYRFNDEGLIDGRWQEFDGIGLFTQLGMIPPMGPGGA